MRNEVDRHREKHFDSVFPGSDSDWLVITPILTTLKHNWQVSVALINILNPLSPSPKDLSISSPGIDLKTVWSPSNN
jgi:hypothetical protein